MRSRLPLAIASLALLTLSATALAAETRFTLEIARKMVGVSSPRVSPDGRSIAFLVTKPDFDKDENVTELWLADATAGDPHALTFDRRKVSSPTWSPDGRTLAFLAPDPDDHPQVWLLALRGGEARRLTKAANGVEHFSWRPDGGAIAYATADTLPKRQGEAKFIGTFQVGDQDLFLRKEIAPQHIWIRGKW